MDWDRLIIEENPKIIKTIGLSAKILVGVYVGLSVFTLTQLNADVFQRLGSLGVGAFLFHYVFIRFTWRRRAESISTKESSAYTSLFIDGAKGADIEKSKQQLFDVTDEKRIFYDQESKSVVIEALLLLTATIQWGFGDLLINAIGKIL